MIATGAAKENSRDRAEVCGPSAGSGCSTLARPIMPAASWAAIGSASTSSRASQPSHSPAITSAATPSRARIMSPGSGGSSGATTGIITSVSATASAARTGIGTSASPKPGSSIIAEPTRASTMMKAKA
jgi:hypothetical protein